MSKPTIEELRARNVERKAALAERARQIESKPTQKTQKTGWEATTVELHSTSGQKPVRVSAKRACYLAVAYGFLPCEFPVTVFVSGRGNVWVGPERDFYIETESGIVGAKRKISPRLIWCESIIKNGPKEKLDLDTLIRRFENKIDGKSLRVAAGHYDLDSRTGERSPEDAEAYLKRETDLIRVLGKFYGPGGDAGGDIVGVHVEGKTVRLDLKGNGSATVWIDINSKKVVKAIWDGKQVYPKGEK